MDIIDLTLTDPVKVNDKEVAKVSPSPSPRGIKLVNNLSPVYNKIAVYECNNIPNSLDIRTVEDFSLLCDALYRDNHLDGYLVEDFICDDVGVVKLHVTLGTARTPTDILKRYNSLKSTRYTHQDIDTLCLNECKFMRNINYPFCDYCRREHGYISIEKRRDMENDILSKMNSSRRKEYRKIRAFLVTPLPDFTCKTMYHDIVLSFSCIKVYTAKA